MWAEAIGIGVVLLIILVYVFMHRDPERTPPEESGLLCPADGIVSAVYTVTGDKQLLPKHHTGITAFLHDIPGAKKIVVITMKPWHVHTQRSPIDGTVKRINHQLGKHLDAVHGDLSKVTAENEHVSINIEGEEHVKVYLIAGLLFRRIKPLVNSSQRVKRGDRIGKIKFGSQVALITKQETINVNVGDKVRAGKTIL